MVHFPDFKTPQDTSRAIVKQERDGGSYSGAMASTAPATSRTTTSVLGTVIMASTKATSKPTHSVSAAQSLQSTSVANLATNTTKIKRLTAPIMTASVA